MLEINVNIKAPELVKAAENLIAVLSEVGKTQEAETPKAKKEDKSSKKEDNEKTTEEKKNTKAAKEEKPLEKEDKSEKQPITIEEVRSKLAKLSQEGKQADVKALITKFGASKLSDIPTEKYAELLKESEGL